MCKAWNNLANRAILLSGMLSYYSLEAAAKEDKTNSKADESVVLVGLVSHPVLRPKSDAHRMYAQDQVVIHTARM
jgi:hypothetical protein